jgi:hypothetical protein
MLALVSMCILTSNSLATIHVISNSNFTMLDPWGADVRGLSSDDVYGTFDDAQLCSDVSCALVDGMTFEYLQKQTVHLTLIVPAMILRLV